MSHKDKRLFNYVVNTLGITKEMILEYIDARLEQLVIRVLKTKLESREFEKLILNRVTDILKSDVEGDSPYYYSRSSFDSFLKSVVRNMIEEKVNLETQIEVKLVRKDKQVVNKV